MFYFTILLFCKSFIALTILFAQSGALPSGSLICAFSILYLLGCSARYIKHVFMFIIQYEELIHSYAIIENYLLSLEVLSIY